MYGAKADVCRLKPHEVCKTLAGVARAVADGVDSSGQSLEDKRWTPVMSKSEVGRSGNVVG